MNSYREPIKITIKDSMHKGPFKNCPACGVDLLFKKCKECKAIYTISQKYCTSYYDGHIILDTYWQLGANPKFCDSLNRFVIKKGFFKNTKCSIDGKHIHQSCYSCGWSGIADPESDDA